MSKKLLESSNHTTRMDQLIAWVYAVIHKYGDGLCCTRGRRPTTAGSLVRSQLMDRLPAGSPRAVSATRRTARAGQGQGPPGRPHA